MDGTIGKETDKVISIMDEVFAKGYDEAKSLFEPKIEELKRELAEANKRIAKLKEVLSNL